MDLTFSTTAVRLFGQWMTRNANVVSPVPADVRRPPYPCETPDTLPLCTPEEQGIESSRISAFYDRLCREPSIKMQTVIIARNGHIISRGHFAPYSTDIWHVSHSLCKSLTGLAIGLLYDDGLLSVDDRVLDILKDNIPPSAYINHRTTTVHHLLTMQSGVIFNEMGAVTDKDWVRAWLESGVKFRPGTAFEYNSMNSYLLSAIVKKLSGQGMLELLRKRVLDPLGIKQMYWEKCPMGIERGGWGLYYYPDDILKIGQLYLNGGVWNGERIISEKWIKESTKAQIQTPQETGIYDYGYQVWCKKDRSTFLFNGMFGQNLIVFPKTNIMIATTAGIDETFQNSAMYSIIERYFGSLYRPHAHLASDPAAVGALREKERSLVMENSDLYKYRTSSLSAFEQLSGSYTVAETDGYGLSLMPELYQGVHNNFAKGLSGITLDIKSDGGFVCFKEGDKQYKVSFGCCDPVPGCIVYGDERILTSSYAVDADGALRISICFPELPNIRYITVIPAKGGIEVKWEEAPGYDFLHTMADRTFLGKFLYDGKTKATDAEFIVKRIKYFLQPSVIMKKGSEGSINGSQTHRLK